MGVLWTIVGILVPLLIGAGLTLGAMGDADTTEFWVARLCFLLSMAIFGGMTTYWALKTDWNLWARVIVCCLVGAAILLILPESLRWVKNRERMSPKSKLSKPQGAQPSALIEKSELVMHSYGDERTPSLISSVNIWRWFYLRMIVENTVPDKKTGKKLKLVIPVLFVTFDHPTVVGTLEVQSPDMRLPRYEVKEFKERFAVITFEEEPPAGTFVIRTH